MATDTSAINIAIAEALRLDYTHIKAIDIRLEAGRFPAVTVEYIDIVDGALSETIAHYELRSPELVA